MDFTKQRKGQGGEGRGPLWRIEALERRRMPWGSLHGGEAGEDGQDYGHCSSVELLHPLPMGLRVDVPPERKGICG